MFAFAAVALLSAQRIARTLVTPHYTVTVTELCEEGEVGCGKVRYTSISKSGKSITLMGKQVMVMCADNVTPCHPIGYRFKNKSVTYFVGEDGELKVTQGSKTLADEQGKWKDE